MDLLELLGRCESYAERVFAVAALPMIPDLEPQIQLGSYRGDFGIRSKGIVVEIDGRAYHGSPTQMKRDRQRDERIAGWGWRVLRFHAAEVIANPAACVGEILDTPEPLPFDEP